MNRMTNRVQSTEQQQMILTRTAKKIAEWEESLKDARKELSDKLTTEESQPADSVTIARCLEWIAECEGQLKAYRIIEREIKSRPMDTIVAKTLLNGVDDTWSGRTNDSKRAAYDGLIKAFRTAGYWIED